MPECLALKTKWTLYVDSSWILCEWHSLEQPCLGKWIRILQETEEMHILPKTGSPGQQWAKPRPAVEHPQPMLCPNSVLCEVSSPVSMI